MISVIFTDGTRRCGNTAHIEGLSVDGTWVEKVAALNGISPEEVRVTVGIVYADEATDDALGGITEIQLHPITIMVDCEPESPPELSPFHQTRQARGKGKRRRDWEK